MIPEAQKSRQHAPSDMRLEGFEQIFDEAQAVLQPATISGEQQFQSIERLLERLTETVSFGIDQRAENAKLATQVIENQRQLIATQQILIRLMEKSIDLTRHISTIEEKLPGVFELPRLVDSIKERVIRLENIEFD